MNFLLTLYTAQMEKITLAQTAQFFYLRVKLEIAKETDLPPIHLEAVTFKSILLQALDSLHGKIGAALNVDILKFDAKSMEAIVRVRERGLVKLWSAMTLFSYYQDRQCAITVIQVSPHLLSLAADSRQWKIEDGLTTK
ncbi:unnamed protein product [Porites evermanni]|uniref:Ribonucleases P/MRP subunit Pop8-like domain-containing protein n=1 Tax=Porites evermanni TaxID=104178 RepID=A0ABN8LU62_9CNID|nr:unnamed protein product [Porites evermanni]